MPGIHATIRLKNLQCHKEWDANGHSEPYLWPIFFHLDASTVVRGDDGYATVHSPLAQMPGPFVRGLDLRRGSAGIDQFPGGVQAGDVLPVPTAIGQHDVIFDEDVLSTDMMMGVIVVLLEHDDTSEVALTAGRLEMERGVQRELDDYVGRLVRVGGLNAIVPPTDAEADAMKNRLSEQVRAAVKDAIGLADKLSVLAGFTSPDTLIDAQVITFVRSSAHDDFTGMVTRARKFTSHYEVVVLGKPLQVDQYYSIEAELEAKPFYPPASDPCRSWVDAVAAAKLVIKTQNQLIAVLQRELSGPFTPGEGPARPKQVVMEEIRRIRSGPLAEAVAKSAQASAGLARCRQTSTFGGRS